MTGGAVQAASRRVRERVLDRVREHSSHHAEELSFLSGGKVLTAAGDTIAELGELLDEPAKEDGRLAAPAHEDALDPETGQGRAHVRYACAAHRAVVDVDTELGLVKVVEIATRRGGRQASRPAGRPGPDPRRHRPGSRPRGHGGDPADRRRGEESFVHRLPHPHHPRHAAGAVNVLELADPHAPYGLRGVGEPPTISSTPAVVAAIRAATGLDLTRVPVRPEHIAGWRASLSRAR